VLVILSQTAAHKRDSIAPSKAIVKAAGRICNIKLKLILNKLGRGKLALIFSTVGTVIPIKTIATDKNKATIDAGIFSRYFVFDNCLGKKTINNIVDIPIIIAKIFIKDN
jgi:hypothetical protein